MSALPLPLVPALPFLLAALMPWAGRRFGARAAWLALVAPVLAALALGRLVLDPAAATTVSVAWMPSLGIDLVFRPDGLALFFGLVVSVVGALVVLYGAFYLDDHHQGHGRFYAALLLFMGAMLGTVLAGNLMQLFVCWELTGLTSFLLIGFNHENKKSAYGARMALLTTAGTGLFLLIGVVLLGQAYGTYDLETMLGGQPLPGNEALLPWAFAACMIGVAGKSAQFPFFFWLPNAMAAPTPVSAYLHSATMVKLGVFLTARLLPVFHDLPAWTPTLVLLGFGTMLLGAALAVLAHDLKAILAYSTISQLGLLVGYYGLFPKGVPVEWDYLHIANHVFYKAALFMVVGIVDHSTGTRDIRQLGGLGRKMPLTAFACLVGVATMGGVPFTTGFLSKEMLLDTTLAFWHGDHLLANWVFGTVVLASVLKIVFSIRIFHRVFCGAFPEPLAAHWHAPSFGLQLAPLLLAAAALGFGMMPGAFGAFCAAFSIPGKHLDVPAALHLWHGFTPALLTSIGIVVAGTVVYVLKRRWRADRGGVPAWLGFDRWFDRAVDGLPTLGAASVRWTQGNRPLHYLPVVLGTALVLWAAWLGANAGSFRTLLGQIEPWPAALAGYHRYFVVALCAAALAIVVFARNWLLELLALSVVGFLVSFFYVLYKAPDLALTQILVETAGLLLVLVFIMRLRRGGHAERRGSAGRGYRGVRLLLALGAGAVTTLFLLVFQNGGVNPAIGDAVLAVTLPAAKGANAVNTTLIDFRGLDTLFEILVLAIATLGCLGLLMRRRVDAPPHPAVSDTGAGARAPVGDSFILLAVVTFLFFLINVFAVYLFFRGHHRPGGGFIAGLCTALSFVMLGFVQGIETLHRFLRIDPMRLAAIGLLVAIASGLVGVFGGGAFLQHVHPYLKNVPLLGDVYLGTPVFFDLGVYLVVVGVVLKIVFPLVKSVQGYRAFIVEEEGAYAAPDEEPIESERGEGGR